GGELVIYGLEWDGEELVFENTNSKNGYSSRLYQQSHQVFDQQYGSMTFKPNIGDMMLFDGGHFYHCIVPTIGDRTRITIGGFLSFSKEHDTIYYWS
ncbi:MAG: 2OG-Fe(II)-dependent halogenase WelO5 family protein, partial [Nostoc sp.]